MESFDPAVYLIENPDIAQILGKDSEAAEKHFMEYGFKEGREFRSQNEEVRVVKASSTPLEETLIEFNPNIYLMLNQDLASTIGTNPDKLKEHYVRWGYKTGRATQPSDITVTQTNDDLPSDLVSLSLHVFPEGAGSVNGSGVFGKGSTRLISASANEGYVFLNWQGDGVSKSSLPSVSVTLEKNAELFAIFRYTGKGEELPDAQIPGSTYIGWGWWSDEWFGNYWNQAGSNWVHHESLGWIYQVPYSQDSIWLWIDYLEGWHWTGEKTYPFLYDHNSSSWIWFQSSTITNDGKRIFFRYGGDKVTGTWEER